MFPCYVLNHALNASTRPPEVFKNLAEVSQKIGEILSEDAAYSDFQVVEVTDLGELNLALKGM